MRYMLGDKKPSLVVGWGNHPPQRPADRASSCPVRVNETCNALVGLYNPKPNPKILKGALIMVRASPSPPSPTPALLLLPQLLHLSFFSILLQL